MLHQQGDEQPPDTTVAVEEGVNGLELDMRQAGADERREIVLGMQPAIEIAEKIAHPLWRRRHEACVSEVPLI